MTECKSKYGPNGCRIHGNGLNRNQKTEQHKTIEPKRTNNDISSDDKRPEWEEAVFTDEECREKANSFYTIRNEKIDELKRTITARPVKTPVADIPEAIIGNNNIKKMLCNKAVWASLKNGVEAEVHTEAAMRIHELLPKGREVARKPGTKPDDPVKEIIDVDSDFTAKDRKDYTATYSVHTWKQKGMKPIVYTFICVRRKK